MGHLWIRDPELVPHWSDEDERGPQLRVDGVPASELPAVDGDLDPIVKDRREIAGQGGLECGR